MTEIYKTVNVFDKQDNFVATFHEVVSVDFGKQGKTIIGTKYGDVELSGEYAVRVVKTNAENLKINDLRKTLKKPINKGYLRDIEFQNKIQVI